MCLPFTAWTLDSIRVADIKLVTEHSGGSRISIRGLRGGSGVSVEHTDYLEDADGGCRRVKPTRPWQHPK